MRIVFGALLALLALPSCATIVKGTTQTIAINTPGVGVPGASCGRAPIDAATGAMNKYAPETIVVMVPIQGCRASG